MSVCWFEVEWVVRRDELHTAYAWAGLAFDSEAIVGSQNEDEPAEQNLVQ